MLKRTRLFIVLAVMCATLVAPSVAVAWHIYTYLGPYARTTYLYGYPSGYNYIQMNRVYRPLFHTFALWYGDGAQYEEDALTNPFVHAQSGGYTNAWCADVQFPGGAYPVTCQYQSFHP